MRYLLILNDPAYGTERSYNGFRLAKSPAGQEGAEVRVFLMGDAVTCALAGQKTPNGYYNFERMLRSTASNGAQVGCCEVPSAVAPPSGCHFHPRCPLAVAKCSTEEPALTDFGGGRVAACHVAEANRGSRIPRVRGADASNSAIGTEHSL